MIAKGYKQTEVGIIPNQWNCLKLGDVIQVLGGGTFKSKDRVENGVKWLKISNVSIGFIKWNEKEYLPSNFITTYKDYLLEKDDVVMALTRPILSKKLKISIIKDLDTPSLLNQRVGKIIINNNDSLLLLYHILQSNLCINGFMDSMAGTDPPNLSNKGIYSVKIPLPPTLKEQEAIAKVLTDTDNLIQGLENVIAKKKAIKKGAMQQLLTPPNKGGKRLPGFSGEWVEKSLGEFCEITSGESPSKFKFKSTGIPYFKVEQLNYDEKYVINTPYYIDIINPVKSKSIVFPKRGASILLNKIRILKEDSYLDTNLMALTTSEFLFYEYLFYYLSYFGLAKIADTTSIPQINNKHIQPYTIYMPSTLKEQEAIATILSDMDKEIEALEVKKEKYLQLKKGLAQELLTGKTRLV